MGTPLVPLTMFLCPSVPQPCGLIVVVPVQPEFLQAVFDQDGELRGCVPEPAAKPQSDLAKLCAGKIAHQLKVSNLDGQLGLQPARLQAHP